VTSAQVYRKHKKPAEKVVLKLGGGDPTKKKTPAELKQERELKRRRAEARRQLQKRRAQEKEKAQERIAALKEDVKKSEACAQGTFVGPELMDLLFRRFEPEGITKEDIVRLSKINDHHSPFDFA